MFILVHILWGFHWSFLENTFFTFYFSILKLFHNPLKNKSYKMFKHTQTIRRQKPSEEIVSVKQALFPKWKKLCKDI